MKHKLQSSLLPILSVALLIVTLGAAFGQLSGRGALIGMLSACILALVTALIGGTRYGISSPTGPMTAAVAVIFASEYGSPELLSLTILISSVLLFLLRSFNAHKLVKWIPNLIIGGFVNGIAALILISQAKGIQGLTNWALLTVSFILSMLIHHARDKFKHPVFEVIASSFVVILIMTFFVHALQIPVEFISIDAQSFKEIANIHIPIFEVEALWIVIPMSFELAIIALLDTLLTGVIMEKESKKKTDFKRELSGQSLAMFLTGWIAGIPGAQSTVPSMMFYKEGAHHRWSKVLVAVTCVLITLLSLHFLKYIPTAVLAGVIFKIAFDVADFTSLKKAKGLQIILLIGTLLSTVFLSLNFAVIGFTAFFLLWNQWSPKKWQIKDLALSESEGLRDEI